MERHELTTLLEALLFVADQPLTVNALFKAVDDDSVERSDIKASLQSLRETYDHGHRGFELIQLGKGYQVVTRNRFAPWIENLLRTRRKARLSRAALESVAVIAYKQPISRLEVERIRGVDVGGVLTTLMERGLIMIKGRDPGPGRPLLYGTTESFLDYFGLSKLGDLPQLDELATLAGLDAEGWSDGEKARFEKFGVDLGSVPTPEAVLHAGPEEPDESGDDEFEIAETGAEAGEPEAGDPLDELHEATEPPAP